MGRAPMDAAGAHARGALQRFGDFGANVEFLLDEQRVGAE